MINYETGNKTPVYVSLTSIHSRQHQLLITLQSIIKQTLLPDKIFLHLSTTSYLLDSGFKKNKINNHNLKNFLINNKNLIEIKWVENTGPYRKLLPLLKEKWNEDCIIITIDDDRNYHNNLIKNLVNDYNKYKCVINYFGFNPITKSLKDFNYARKCNVDFKLQNIFKPSSKHIHNLPTGSAGILYKPEFFHKTNDLIFNKEIYMKTCKTNDDIWFYSIRIKNNIECYIDLKKKWFNDKLENNGLYNKFNCKKNRDTVAFINTLKKIEHL